MIISNLKQLLSQPALSRKHCVIAILLLCLLAKSIHKFYRRQLNRIITKDFFRLPRDCWKNSYPIVLVHGFAGSAPDQSWVMPNYFELAIQASHGLGDIFLAVVSPAGGTHDRACELYQQLVGVDQIRKRWGLASDECGPSLVKAVYGHRHFCEEHQQQTVYKPRLLRQIRDGKVVAFPNGMPGGWSSAKKIHLIGHSMGAQTSRYLQYLLSVDYFEQNKLEQGQFASLHGKEINFDFAIKSD